MKKQQLDVGLSPGLQLEWMAHDLKVPLDKIHMLCELAQILEDDTSPKIIEVLQGIQKICKDSTDFIHHVLKDGQTPIDFYNVVGESFEKVSSHQNYSPIVTHIEIDIDQSFYSSKQQIQSIIDNLIQNAYHYHDLNKSEPFIRIMVAEDEAHLYIEVEDNGQGIPQYALPFIFQPKYRGVQTDSKGSGMGLHLVHSLVEQLKGRIKVESELNQNTLFQIRLPKKVSNHLSNQHIQNLCG